MPSRAATLNHTNPFPPSWQMRAQVAQQHLADLCGDLLPHTITNVGLNKRTAYLMKDSLLDDAPPRDRPFVRAFMETQMFTAHSDAVISAFCEQQY